MSRFGTISYNIYCNFTNYGSALQTWALHRAIEKLGHTPVLVDYCPDILADKDPLNPFKNMWDKGEEARRMCELSMPAIRKNYEKFDVFYHKCFNRTIKKYTSFNFNEVVADELLDGFVCGSDTIFFPEELGFDDGFFANYNCMKNGYTFSYAASFGDAYFTEEMNRILNSRMQNFKLLGIRENRMIPYLKEHVNVPVQQVIDPTLLLTAKEYNSIVSNERFDKKYLLLYSRRYSKPMEEYAEKLAKKNGWEIIEISLRATNELRGHHMFYEAGVEEFLSLVKNASFVVTNSYHGIIFSVQFRRPFVVFLREKCNSKIEELLSNLKISDRILLTGKENYNEIDYNEVHRYISESRIKSMSFLSMALNGLKG